MISLLESMEEDLYPFPDTINWNGSKGEWEPQVHNTAVKLAYYAGHALMFAVKLAVLPLFAAYSGVRSLAEHCIDWINKPEKPEERPKPVDEKLQLSDVLPDAVGTADSLFQTSGLTTKYSALKMDNQGTCYWDPWLTAEHIEGNPDFKSFFIDVLGDPDRFIEILKGMNVTAYRFSIEWAFIETTEGKYNANNIALYKTFMEKLEQAGIKSYVTLHHYNHPQWFEDKGGFHDQANIKRFQQYALKMVEELPNVTFWYTFNEVGGLGLQTMRGDFPCEPTIDGTKVNVKGDAAAAGRLMRNILMAHCNTYKAIKEKYKAQEKVPQVGITHQFLHFVPLKGNAIEQLVCRYFSKITHEATYNFLKTGVFSLQLPGQANVRLVGPKPELDALGFQGYGDAKVMAGWNGGKPWPGNKIHNFCWGPMGFSFGATCQEGNRVSSFGPEINANAIRRSLEEAVAINTNLHISEIGCDGKSQGHGEAGFKKDTATQRAFFEKLPAILKDFKDNIKAFFVWTAFTSEGLDNPGQLEWNRGALTKLGIVEISKDADHRITGHKLTEAATYLQGQFKTVKERVQQKAQELLLQKAS